MLPAKVFHGDFVVSLTCTTEAMRGNSKLNQSLCFEFLLLNFDL